MNDTMIIPKYDKFVSDLNESKINYEKENLKLFKILVPDGGNAETLEGELLRAINKIKYRDMNDGDIFYSGYGAETCGSAATYLIVSKDFKKYAKELNKKVAKILDDISWHNIQGRKYTASLDKILKLIIDYILSLDGKYNVSNEDMLDTISRWEDDDDDYDDEDDY